MAVTVFLADDHTVVRDGLHLLLDAQPDITVIGEAQNGREALRLVAELGPDVVLMDIAMPELNGIEATRLMLSTEHPPKVIVLSMHSSNEYVFQALQAGATGYLLKESASAEVTEAIRAVSRGQHYLSNSISAVVIRDYLTRREAVEEDNPLQRLSSREREVLQLIVEGKTTTEIADIACLSPKTVETYRSRLMKKLEIDNLPDLVKFSIRHGLTSLET